MAQLSTRSDGKEQLSTGDRTDRNLHLLNKISLFCHTALTILLTVMALIFVLAATGLTAIKFSFTWMWVAGCILSVPEIIAFVISNKLLHKHYWRTLEPENPVSSDDYIIIRKFAWMYSPDKLEQWLEKMENQGCYLSQVGKRGRSFFFVRNRSGRMKYCVDYQLMADTRYFHNHSQAGWRPLFTTYGSFGKWTIWAKEYDEDQKRQPLYSGNRHLLSHALRVAAFYSSILVPLAIIYAFGVKAAVDSFISSGIVSTIDWTLIIFALFLLSFTVSTVQAWLYFLRMRSLAKTSA